METERNEEETTESYTDTDKAAALADIEVALDSALRAGVQEGEIRRLVKEVLEYSM